MPWPRSRIRKTPFRVRTRTEPVTTSWSSYGSNTIRIPPAVRAALKPAPAATRPSAGRETRCVAAPPSWTGPKSISAGGGAGTVPRAYSFGDVRFPRSPAPPLPAQPDAARARPRDAPQPRPVRDAALRRARVAPARPPARDGPVFGRRRRPRGRGARPARRAGGDPLRDPRGEGRAGDRSLGGRRDRAARIACPTAALPRARAHDRRLPLRVHVA